VRPADLGRSQEAEAFAKLSKKSPCGCDGRSVEGGRASAVPVKRPGIVMPMSTLRIEAIPCLRDNYAYLISGSGGDAWIVDPSEPGPLVEALAQRPGLALRGILATHHHCDHVGGIEALVAAAGDDPPWVAGHASDRGRIPRQSVFVDAPDDRFVASGIELGGRPLLAMWIPGHTMGAIAWHLPARPDEDDTAGDVFTGDTLFAAGCGRLFEGTAAQMYTSLQNLTSLPPATRLWFGHEYTAANLRFAATIEPESSAVRDRQAQLSVPSTPTSVALEVATNPFVRSSGGEELAQRRAAKDVFRG